MRLSPGSSTAPPEPVRALSVHLLRAAGALTPLPRWMSEHALTAMSPAARQVAWAVGRRVTGNPDHGFAIAERVPPDAIGSLWPLYRSAPTLAALYRAYPRVAPLLLDVARPLLVERPGSVLIEYVLPDGMRVDRAEEDMRATLDVANWRALHGRDDIWPLSVAFSYPRPRTVATHQRVLGTRELAFAAPRLRLEIARTWWQAPLPGADAVEFAHQLARASEAARAVGESALDLRVEGLLMQLLDSDARAERIADLLGISVRTLHRQLSRHGSSFRALLERARRREYDLLAQAQALYGVPVLSSSARARLLGFANAGALRNALRRWGVRS